MAYKGRSLYNLLAMNLKRDPSLEVDPWQVVNYREMEEKELFQGLEGFGIYLDHDHLKLYIEESDSPEDLSQYLAIDENVERQEQIYLLIFEVWRRQASTKQSLSLFCDELDHQIELYEEGKLENDEDLQVILLYFQNILDDFIDDGGELGQGLLLVAGYSCHDLEIFLYEYISHQIDLENDIYASEVLDGFYPHLNSKRWFDFLRVRLVTLVDSDESEAMLERLLEQLRDPDDLHLIFEILTFMIYTGHREKFQQAFFRAHTFLRTEADLRELLQLASDFLNSLEEEGEGVIREIQEARKDREGDMPLDPTDPALDVLRDLILIESV